VSQALQKIQSLHVDAYIASGDKEAVVSSLVAHLEQNGMSRGKIIAQGGMTPVTKKSLVDSLRAKGKIVAFVGDGINDAPAIAAADVGIAMGGGSDVAASSAGLVIQRAGLSTLVEAIELSVRVTRVIRENFFWAFFYNVAAIPFAVAGQVTPMWAAAAMAFSSVSVVLNALRLTR
jgi:Cu+-exporting ATPase